MLLPTLRFTSAIKVFAVTRIVVFGLCILCCLAGELAAQDFKTVHDGVEYAQVEHKLGSDPVKINLLRLDLKKVRLDVHHAFDRAIGLETTSSIAKRKGAVAAINAGFFRLDKSSFAGDAAGVLMIDGRLLSDSTNRRIAVFMSNRPTETLLSFAHIDIGNAMRLNKKEFRFDGINRERKSDELIRFTPEFNTTTLTDDTGVEVAVENGRIISVNDGKGNTEIPKNGYVISAAGKGRGELLPLIKRGRKIRLTTFVMHHPGVNGIPEDTKMRRTTSAFAGAEDITNGVPQLIKDGKIDITWREEKAGKAFVEARHPRTAVAKLRDGKFLMVTVDGRQAGASVGMTLNELAEYLLGLGAIDAMNLDGGGSTTMYLEGKVVNTPSDKEGERKIGDAIVVTLRPRSR